MLATSAGTINRVSVTNLGGKVVWIRDPVRNANIYFAHLDSQVVQNGDRVEVGDTIGFVGNTGNARTTPPHLHFGIYRRGEGAVDPAPFIRPVPRVRPATISADLHRLGSRNYEDLPRYFVWIHSGRTGDSHQKQLLAVFLH